MQANNNLKKILDSCKFYPRVNQTKDKEKNIDFESRKIGLKEKEGVGLTYNTNQS